MIEATGTSRTVRDIVSRFIQTVLSIVGGQEKNEKMHIKYYCPFGFRLHQPI